MHSVAAQRRDTWIDRGISTPHLQTLCTAGALHFRLNSFALSNPSLRDTRIRKIEQGEDILAEHNHLTMYKEL